MKRTAVMMAVLAVLFCWTVVAQGTLIDEILFGNGAGRESESSPPTPHNLLKQVYETYGTSELLWNSGDYLQWDFATPSAGTQTLTMHVQDVDTEGHGGHLFQVSYDGGTNWSDYLYPDYVDAGNDIKTYELTVPGDATGLRCLYRLQGSYVWMFDANVTPEPATLTVLGLGGVFALLRRRW